MGQVKKLIMQEEKKFWEKCDNIMKNSETILEFFGRVEASQKDGDVIRPEHISYEQFTEDSYDNWNKVWSDYN